MTDFKDPKVLAFIIIGVILAIVGVLWWPVDMLIASLLIGVGIILVILPFLLFREGTPPTKEPDRPAEEKETYVPAVEEEKAALAELPIETIEGIGDIYGKELRAKGINTVEDLLGYGPDEIAQICDVTPEEARKWIAMGRYSWLDSVSEEDAEAIVFVTDYTTLEDLAGADASALLAKIQAGLDAGEFRVPAGYEFTLKNVEEWIEEAKSLI
jgi:hypothetical protein